MPGVSHGGGVMAKDAAIGSPRIERPQRIEPLPCPGVVSPHRLPLSERRAIEETDLSA
jgi:hypothetical protein